MGMGIGEASRELAALQELFESGEWAPSGPERTCASLILIAHPRTKTADALVEGLRIAGPDAAQPGDDRLARVVVRCAIALRQNQPSGNGARLVQDLYDLLNHIVAAPRARRRLLNRS
jgi:hypothetical protein